MIHYEDTHVLALDVRHSRIGYALFAGPKLLMDWGASSVPSQCKERSDWAHRRMKALLRLCSPALIVVKLEHNVNKTNDPAREPIVKAVLDTVERHGIPMRKLETEEIRAAFRIFQSQTKDDVACVLVRIFPELLVRLPPKRRAWQSEPHRMIIFDAIATGFAYWQQQSPQE